MFRPVTWTRGHPDDALNGKASLYGPIDSNVCNVSI